MTAGQTADEDHVLLKKAPGQDYTAKEANQADVCPHKKKLINKKKRKNNPQ